MIYFHLFKSLLIRITFLIYTHLYQDCDYSVIQELGININFSHIYSTLLFSPSYHDTVFQHSSFSKMGWQEFEEHRSMLKYRLSCHPSIITYAMTHFDTGCVLYHTEASVRITEH